MIVSRAVFTSGMMDGEYMSVENSATTKLHADYDRANSSDAITIESNVLLKYTEQLK